MDGVLTLGPSAASWRRRLAPLAWCALEVLAEHTQVNGDGVVADVSVRGLAEELGVAKNTALRALKTLRAAGIVEHWQERDSAGRYNTSGYRLALPTDVVNSQGVIAQLRVAEGSPVEAKRQSVPKRQREAPVEQLVLLSVG